MALPLNPKSPDLIRVLQINLNHCQLAQDLMMQSCMAFEANIVVISEP